MATEIERLAVQCLHRGDAQVEEAEGEEPSLLATEVGRFAPRKARIQFGDAHSQRRPPRVQPSQTSHNDVEVSQLPLF
jgi:hypothetical protein